MFGGRTSHSGRGRRRTLPNQSLDQLPSMDNQEMANNNLAGMSSGNEDRIARFSTHKSENRYLEMKAKREELKNIYVQQGKMADPNHVYQLDEAVPFVAECMDMCPEYEREEREYTNFLEPFEKIPGTERVDHTKAVKRYKRSAAGDPPPLPCDVRPPKILFKTLDYLFHDIIGTHGVAASHSFVRDRARSIRNDLTLQNYTGVEAVILHERIARYHIMCSNFLCGSEGFVMQQEEEQLRKTLLSLMEFYSEMSSKGIVMTNEAEFQAYYILTLPWSNDVPSRLEKELVPAVFFDERVQLAMKVRFLMTRREEANRPSVDGSLNHYAKIFSIIKKDATSYLLACCIHMHFRDIRKSAIRAIQKSYYHTEADPSSGLLLSEIIESLGFDGEEDAIAFLKHYFIDVGEGVDGKVAYVGRKVITDSNGKQKPGDYPKFPYTIVPDNPRLIKSEVIESKRKGMSYIDILDGKYVSIDSRNGSSPVILSSPLKKPSFPTSTPSFPSAPSSNNGVLFNGNGNLKPAFTPTPFRDASPSAAMNGSTVTSAPAAPAFSFKAFVPSTVPTALAPAPPLFQIPSTSSKAIPIINPATKAPVQLIPKSSTPIATPSIGDLRSLVASSKKPSLKSSILPKQERAVPSPPAFQFSMPPPLNPSSQSTNHLPPKPLILNPTIVPSSLSTGAISVTSPKSIFAATQFDATAKNVPKRKLSLDHSDFAQDLFNHLYEDLVCQEVQGLVKNALKNREKLKTECALEVFKSLMNSIVAEEIQERLMTHRKLDNWRTALDIVISNLCYETANDLIREIAVDAWVEKTQERRLCIFVRDRWKFHIVYIKYQRLKQELIGKKMVSYLRQSILVPPSNYLMDNRVDVDGNDASMGAAGVGEDMIESRLADVAREMQEKRATWYERIRLEAQVLPFLDASRPLGSNYKLLLCTSDYRNKVTGTLGWFADSWLCSKLSHLQDDSEYLADSFIFQKPGPSVLMDETFAYDGGEETRILFYHIDDTNLTDEGSLSQKHNSECEFSGCNGAVFQCDYYSFSKYKTKREYWDHMSRSLIKFVSALPLHAKIPLVMVYWPSSGLTEQDFAENYKSKLSFPLNDSPFSQILVLYLQVSTESFDSQESSSQLQRSLIWVLDNASLPPPMSSDILSNCEGLARKYEWAITKLESLVSSHQAFEIPQLHAILGTQMSKLHNDFLEHLIKVLCDVECVQLAFPASEFVGEDGAMRSDKQAVMEWNKPEVFYEFQTLAQAMTIPPFAYSEWTTPNKTQVVNMYIRYVDSIAQLSGMSAATLDSLKSLILSPSSHFAATSTQSQPEKFPCAQIWFAISNALIALFASQSNGRLQCQFYRKEKLDNVGDEFARACQGLVAEFMHNENVLQLLAREIEGGGEVTMKSALVATCTPAEDSTFSTARKRKIDEQEVDAADRERREPNVVGSSNSNSPLDNLKKAMERATLLLSSLDNNSRQ